MKKYREDFMKSFYGGDVTDIPSVVRGVGRFAADEILSKQGPFTAEPDYGPGGEPAPYRYDPSEDVVDFRRVGTGQRVNERIAPDAQRARFQQGARYTPQGLPTFESVDAHARQNPAYRTTALPEGDPQRVASRQYNAALRAAGAGKPAPAYPGYGDSPKPMTSPAFEGAVKQAQAAPRAQVQQAAPKAPEAFKPAAVPAAAPAAGSVGAGLQRAGMKAMKSYDRLFNASDALRKAAGRGI